MTNRILVAILLLSLVLPGAMPAAAAQTSSTIPTFAIIAIVPNNTITLRTYNFPAHKIFGVSMGLLGNQSTEGVPAGAIDSGSGGSFTAVVVIPAPLRGQSQIAVRLQANDGSGFFAYNWFYNQAPAPGPWNPGPFPPPPPPGPLPTPKPMPVFWINGVIPDTSVSIVTQNFPANKVFNAYMNYMGTRGIGGVYVGSVSTGAGGSLNYSFNIPYNLRGLDKIALRLEVNDTSGWFAYNWFYNTGH
jgi:hypothetical protein